MTNHDAIAIQLCLSAGLTQENAETLIDRIVRRYRPTAQNSACPHDECPQGPACLVASACVDSWDYVCAHQHIGEQPSDAETVAYGIIAANTGKLSSVMLASEAHDIGEYRPEHVVELIARRHKDFHHE